MVDLEPDPDFFADRVVVVTRHKGHDLAAAGQLQGVDEIGAPEPAFIQTFGQRISEFPVRVTSLRRAADQVAYVIDLDPRVAR